MKTVTGNGNEWVREEFHQIDFGDKRLKERSFETAGLLSSKASGSIHQSFMAPGHKPKVLIDFLAMRE